MCYGPWKCGGCGKTGKGDFTEHALECTKGLSDEELLEGLYKTGGCSREYYESEIAKLKE